MNLADILIHVNPELDANKRTDVTRKVESHVGVDCAEFNHHIHPHALIVKYDPDAVQSMEILNMVRHFDSKAAIVGL